MVRVDRKLGTLTVSVMISGNVMGLQEMVVEGWG